ncbi:MAG: hypothetical protein ABI123_08305 [Ginsengibacter sp.]
MKFTLAKIGLFLISLVLFNTAQAKIWRLNNNGNNPNPAIVADFTGTLQEVHNSAEVVSGDTIHVEQSPTSYGDCTFTKRLVVIGSGYFLDKNPKTQVNVNYESKVGVLTFYNNNTAGTHVFGLTTSTIYMGVNNLLIARCYIPSAVIIGNTGTQDLDGMTLRQCYISLGGIYGGTAVVRNNSGTGQITNLSIVNNIIIAGTQGAVMTLSAKTSGILKNNVLSSPYNYGINIQNFYVVNNIGLGTATNTFTNSIVEYNTGNAAGMFVAPAGTNNTIGLGNQTKNATQIAFFGGTSYDNMYSLQVSSECIGAGKDGVDCGIFAGNYPYKLSGIPPVPNIYDVVIAPISAGATNISVTVSAKGNN